MALMLLLPSTESLAICATVSKDSGWIEVDTVSALIGTNESGKTNVLIPLWKLNPAREGEISPLADYPRKRYTEIRNLQKKPVFIEAHFELSDALIAQVRELTECEEDEVRVVSVKRDFNGNYFVAFPQAITQRQISTSLVTQPLEQTRQALSNITTAKSEQAMRDEMLGSTSAALATLPSDPQSFVNADDVASVLNILKQVDISSPPVKKSVIVPQYDVLLSKVEELQKEISRPHPSEMSDVQRIILDNLPSFVYYSNYGNLDSEIYLPHVIQNFSRKDLGSREAAKVRTLKVLFDFVGLNEPVSN